MKTNQAFNFGGALKPDNYPEYVEYLSAVVPRGDASMLMLLRYPRELVDLADYQLPEGQPAKYRVTAKEIEMAKQLIDSMSGQWEPANYRDEFRDRLRKAIEKRLKSKRVVMPEEAEATLPENAATNVVDFMALLQKSLSENKRTPARKAAKSRRKEPAKKKAATSTPSRRKRKTS